MQDETDGLDGVTYYPPDYGFSPEEAERRRVTGRWAMAREDYLSGDTAETVCRRYDLALGTLRHRAAHEGWRRRDQDEVPPPPRGRDRNGDRDHLTGLDLSETTDPSDADYAVLSRRALASVALAMAQGRAGEAGTWMRLHERLSRMAEATRSDTPASVPSSPPPPPPPEPDPLDAVEEDVRELEDMVRRLSAMDTSDPAARAAFEADLERMQSRTLRAAASLGALDFAAFDSDVSDFSDPVFRPPPAPSPLE